MNAIVVNDLSLNTELDAKALAEIVGGGTLIVSTPWKYLRCQYKYQSAYVDV